MVSGIQIPSEKQNGVINDKTFRPKAWLGNLTRPFGGNYSYLEKNPSAMNRD